MDCIACRCWTPLVFRCCTLQYACVPSIPSWKLPPTTLPKSLEACCGGPAKMGPNPGFNPHSNPSACCNQVRRLSAFGEGWHAEGAFSERAKTSRRAACCIRSWRSRATRPHRMGCSWRTAQTLPAPSARWPRPPPDRHSRSNTPRSQKTVCRRVGQAPGWVRQAGLLRGGRAHETPPHQPPSCLPEQQRPQAAAPSLSVSPQQQAGRAGRQAGKDGAAR